MTPDPLHFCVTCGQPVDPGFGEWQPIETAPKDGTEIAVLAQDGAWVVFWRKFTGHEGDGGWQIKKAAGRDPVLCIHNPLGWMPLPAPPAEGG